MNHTKTSSKDLNVGFSCQELSVRSLGFVVALSVFSEIDVWCLSHLRFDLGACFVSNIRLKEP